MDGRITYRIILRRRQYIVSIGSRRKIKLAAMAAISMVLFTAAVWGMCVKINKILEDRESEKLSKQNISDCQDEASGDYGDEGAVESDRSSVKTDDAGNLRLQEYDFVNVSNMLVAGNYIDVRIAFPNGVDCIVLSCKKLVGNNGGSIILCVNEDEIMRMASARVDAKRYADCMVYAVRYAEHDGKESICNYPVNSEVYKAFSWNPNVKEKDAAQGTLKYASKRGELEKSLETYVIN